MILRVAAMDSIREAHSPRAARLIARPEPFDLAQDKLHRRVRARRVFLLGFFLCTGSLASMTFDNRFFPLLDKPVIHKDNNCFFFRVQPFYMFADRSFSVENDTLESSDEIGLFNIFGRYDQRVMNNALIHAGVIEQSLIPASITLPEIPWSMQGRLDSAGVAMRWYYALAPWLELGGSWFLMGARSRTEFLLRETNLNLQPGDRHELFVSNDEILRADSVNDLLWRRVGVGDLDMYLRVGGMCHYFHKLRTIDAGLKVGMIAPIASRADVDNPASVPFGGNGHWGIYFGADLNAELREDWFAGFDLRFIKRFARSQMTRLPVINEPLNVAALITTANIEPGLTVAFTPYFMVTDFRDGFGFNLSYSLIHHDADTLLGIGTQKSPVNLELFERRSEWALEYVTCSLTYDFAKNKECRGATPFVALDIDIPVNFLASMRSFKTYGVSLRIESELW